MSTAQPLAGATVVEASAFVAAPLAGMLLAQLGAQVLRIDPIGGGLDYGRWPLAASGRSLYWSGLNKGKRSVALDVRSAEGRDIVSALIAKAGAFLTNLPARDWLGYEALRRRRPDLIMLAISGNRDGTIAVDYTVNAATGLPWATGDGSRPVNHVFPVWDVTAALNAVIGMVVAQRHRDATGEGQLVSTALADAALAMLSHLGFIAEAQLLGRGRPALGNAVYGTFGRDFATRDGRRIMIVAVTQRQWRALVEATGIAAKLPDVERLMEVDLDDEGDRFRAREVLFALIEPWVAGRDLADLRRTFDSAGVLWGPFQTFTQLVAEDPRCSTANPMFAEIDQAEIGRHLAAGLPLDFGGFERQPPQPAPSLGEDTGDVLSDLLGLGGAELARLREAGVIGSTNARPE